jgi:hypothetical protein
MAEQERISLNQSHRRQREAEQQLLGANAQGASSVYQEGREIFTQRFDEFLATMNSPEVPAAGSSAPLGQQQPHIVARPRSTGQIVKHISNEQLVEGFRQTSGE